MSNMIKASLVALSILAGASAGYAADNNNGSGSGDFSSDGRPENRVTTPDIWEREQMVDPGSTGSVQGCETDSLDEFGNCIVDPNMQ